MWTMPSWKSRNPKATHWWGFRNKDHQNGVGSCEPPDLLQSPETQKCSLESERWPFWKFPEKMHIKNVTKCVFCRFCLTFGPFFSFPFLFFFPFSVSFLPFCAKEGGETQLGGSPDQSDKYMIKSGSGAVSPKRENFHRPFVLMSFGVLDHVDDSSFYINMPKTSSGGQILGFKMSKEGEKKN